MAFEKITENVENISLLADTPAMTPTELKAEFDKGNKTIKTKFNKLVDDLNEKAVVKDVLEGTTLYDNSTGTTGDVTLSSSIATIKRIRISGYHLYNENTRIYFTQEFNVVPNTNISLFIGSYNGATNSYFANEVLTLTDLSLVRGSQIQIRLPNTDRIDTSVYITKVVGFDY